MTRLQQAPLLEEQSSVPSTDDKLLALMRRLGIESFPHHETLLIPIERIVVPGADLLRISQRLVKSIKQVGVLQMPAVERISATSIHDPQASWQVIFGRRRVLAARLAGLSVIKCETYEPGTPQLASLLALIENDQRSTAWVKEVQDLHRLIGEKVGMTIDDLVTFGFDRGSLKERLKIAQLPMPFLTAIFAGKLNETIARKIARLGPSQQQSLANQILGGEELTPELIKKVLRRQVNDGLAPLQKALEASMAATFLPEPSSGEAAPASIPVSPAFPLLATGRADGEPASPLPSTDLAQVLTTLKGFERELISSPQTQTIRLLTRSLIQQLEVAERSAFPLVVHSRTETPEVSHV